MSDETIASSLLRQEGPQQELDLAPIKARQKARSKIEHLHGNLCLSAFEGQQASDDCVALIAEIERKQARIGVLEGSIDYLRHVIDHPVTQEPVQVYAIVTALLNEHDISDATHGNYDAETFKRRLGDLWMQRVECVLEGRCPIPPFGWRCTRTPGHDGPCAAIEAQSDLPHPVPPAEGEK